MKLLKVSVPNFRNLQNVELTFEPDLSPSVFPIASQNGGGKSTLLQLIFTLLHCSLDKERYKFIGYIFNSYKRKSQKYSSCIAKIDFLYKGQLVSISFNVSDTEVEENSCLQELLSALNIEDKIKERIINLQEKLNINEEQNQKTIGQTKLGRIVKTNNASVSLIKSKILEEYDLLNDINQIIDRTKIENRYLHSSLITIDTNREEKAENNKRHFYCSIDNNIEYDLALEAFTFLSSNIFLAAPSTQPFLFLDKQSKQKLFEDLSQYCQLLTEKKDELPNLYLYSQLTISELTETFKKAKDKDWKQALKSLGDNNSAYVPNIYIKQLTEDFHNFLGNDKYILPTPELDSIVVQKQISETERIELEPEDLSHGELRRLGLYAWIKYNIPENSIILIDEVENALHPDWQYNIADELASWGNNQYLLATHSFHLCEALTPKHVKEIEPKMCKPDSKVVD